MRPHRIVEDRKDNGPLKVIKIPATIADVLQRDNTLADIAFELMLLDIPRRRIPEWISERVDHFDGEIIYSDGRRFTTEPGEIDDAFGDEPTMKWVSDTRRFLATKPRQRPQKKVQRRLLLLMIALTNERCFRKYTGDSKPSITRVGFGYKRVELDGRAEATVRFRPADAPWVALHCGGRCPLHDRAWLREAQKKVDAIIEEIKSPNYKIPDFTI